MTFIHHRKRLAHARLVQQTLNQILNDPSAMPNADCEDLLVSVSRVAFGRTVREIYLDVHGRSQKAHVPGQETPHQKYQREANERGEGGYLDLTDMFCLPGLTDIIATELKRRLRLRYTPTIRRFSDLSKQA